MTNYIQALTDLQNRYDAEPNPARRFELLADMSRVLDAVIYAVRQAQK